MVVLCATGPAYTQKLPICCEDFTGRADDRPDRTVDVNDLLALLAEWGQAPPTHPSPDIAPFSADGCPAGGDGVVDVGDLLALLSSWGPCDSAVDDCAGVLDPDNTYARISGDGVYPFRINGLLDGPRRGPTNDIADTLGGSCLGPTTIGWANYGTNAILGQYQFGDLFGIDMRTDPFTIGGDVWFLFSTDHSGFATFEITSACGDGELADSMVLLYPAAGCPTDWRQNCGGDDESGTISECGNHASHTRAVQAGDEFFVQIGGWLAERGDGALHVATIDNSIFEQAMPLDVPRSIHGYTNEANVPAAPPCDGVAVEAAGHWFRIVGDGTILTARTCDGEILNPVYDTRLSVYCSTDGTEAGLACIAAVQDDTCGLHESVSWCSDAGRTYYILVHGTAGVPEPFESEGLYALDVFSTHQGCGDPIACDPP